MINSPKWVFYLSYNHISRWSRWNSSIFSSIAVLFQLTPKAFIPSRILYSSVYPTKATFLSLLHSVYSLVDFHPTFSFTQHLKRIHTIVMFSTLRTRTRDKFFFFWDINFNQFPYLVLYLSWYDGFLDVLFYCKR